MATHNKKNAIESANALKEGQDAALDIKLLARAIKELNVSRTNTGMYPPDHPQISRGIERAHEIMQKLNASWPTLTLGVTKNGLLLGGEQLDPKSAVFREFATALSSRGIASVTFTSGLSREELVVFNRIATTDPVDIRDAGGVSRIVSKAGLSHIILQALDYRYFHLTEEEEISQASRKVSREKPTDLWNEFVGHLTSGKLASDGHERVLESWGNVDPIRLAGLINEEGLDPAALLGSYEVIITKHLSRESDPQTLEKLNTLLRNLRPELKRQFLSVTFEQLNQKPAELLKGFSEDIVLEMLRQANEEGREISPTLLAMVRELSMDGVMAALPQGALAKGDQEAAPELSSEQLTHLFDREDYEDYVDAEYSSTLENLSGAREEGGAGGGEVPSESLQESETNEESSTPQAVARLEGFREAVDDGALASRICFILLALMGKDPEPDDYQLFTEKIVEFAPDLLLNEDFELLLRIILTLRQHVSKKSAALAQVAGKALQSLTGPDFIAQLVNAFVSCRKRKTHEATTLMLALGDSCVGNLLDLYVKEDFPASNRVLANLIRQFGRIGLEEAYQRLGDIREHVVRNLLMFIQKNGEAASIPHIRPLMAHLSHWARMDALATLLSLGDSEAMVFLRRALRSKVPEESSQAIALAGSYRAVEVVNDLLGMMKTTVFRKSAYKRNEEIIKALGRIGDPKAIPILVKMARRTWSFFPSEHKRVKVNLFDSLSGYPPECLNQLIEIGEHSADYRISKICMAMSKSIKQ
jgi:hypothetical protein